MLMTFLEDQNSFYLKELWKRHKIYTRRIATTIIFWLSNGMFELPCFKRKGTPFLQKEEILAAT